METACFNGEIILISLEFSSVIIKAIIGTMGQLIILITDDVRQGHGTLMYANGDSFSGNWANDTKNGWGVYKFKGSHFTFAGNFVNGLKEGYGEIYLDQHLEEPFLSGTFSNNALVKVSAKFEMENSSFDLYEGDVKNGKFHGQGNYTSNCGQNYNGFWLENQKSGQGVFSWQNGESYLGTFKNDVPHGYGTFTWNDGTKYSGHFSNGTIVDNEGVFL